MWNKLYDDTLNEILAEAGSSLTVKAGASDVKAVLAYKQWAEGWLTQTYFNKTASTQASEIHNFLKTLFDDDKNISAENKAYLSSVNFITSEIDKSASLFLTDDSKDAKTSKSSLLNKESMQKLCELGSTVPNIIKEKSETLGYTFNLTS